MRGLVALLLVGTTLVACGDGRGRGSNGVVIDTLANGAIQITSPMTGRWAPGEAWVLEEELRIGVMDGGGPDMFGRITALDADAHGRIFVLEEQARELRIFEADGTHFRTVGREGAGPGEFLWPTGIAVHPIDGTVWVSDPQTSRYSVFDRDGAFLTTHLMQAGIFMFLPWPGGFTHDGYLVDFVQDRLVRLGADLAPVDSIATPTSQIAMVRVVSPSGTPFMSFPPPFGPRLQWRFDRNGHLWWGTSDRIHLTRIGFSTDDERIVRREHESIPVSRAEADSARTHWEQVIARNSGPSGSRLEGSLDSPPFKPAFETFLVDDAGRLWIEMSRAENAPARELHVFDSDGSFLGPVEIDPGFETLAVLPAFRGDVIHAVVTNEFDVQSVVRYRIRGMQ